MRKMISTILASALLGTAFIAPVSTATAEPRWERGGWSDADDQWRWRHRDRDRHWERDRHSDRRDWRRGDRDRDDDEIVAGIAGFAAGALVGSLATGNTSSHVDRCLARYRSYDPATNTYLGYDGYRHPCTL